MKSHAPARATSARTDDQNVVLLNRRFPLNWRAANSQFQQRFLAAALAKHSGNKTHAARALGISRRAFQLQLRSFTSNL